MPPQKRTPAASKSKPSKPSQPRPSTLAKQHNISPSTELSIREAFTLFSQPSPSHTLHGILPSSSFRRALTALGIPPSSSVEARELLDTVDPTSSGEIEYEHFVGVAAIKLQNRGDGERDEEVEEGFRLFLGVSKDGRERVREQRITLGMLKRVARELKLEGEVGEGVMRDMILEANGGAGVERGVKVGEFEGVMRRAGVFK